MGELPLLGCDTFRQNSAAVFAAWLGACGVTRLRVGLGGAVLGGTCQMTCDPPLAHPLDGRCSDLSPETSSACS